MKRFLIVLSVLVALSFITPAQDRKPSPLTQEQNKSITQLQSEIKAAQERKRTAEAELQAVVMTLEATVREFFIQNNVDSKTYTTRLEAIGGRGDVFGFSEKPKPTPTPESKPTDKK